MYLINRWQVATPVLGLIDEVAEKYGYYPVPTPTDTPAKSPSSRKQEKDVRSESGELEESAASIA